MRRRDLGDLLVTQRLTVVVARNLAAAHLVAVGVARHGSLAIGPFAQQPDRFGGQLVERFLVALPQHQQRFIAVCGQRVLRVRLEFGR